MNVYIDNVCNNIFRFGAYPRGNITILVSTPVIEPIFVILIPSLTYQV